MKSAQLDSISYLPADIGVLSSGRVCFFLDFDGTLVEFADTPDAITVDASVTSLLVDLSNAFNGAVALVSGRSIASLHRALAPTVVPMAGQHGLEIYRPGADVINLARLPDEWGSVVERLERFVSGRPGLLLEHKGLACALHYRRRPELEAEILSAVDHLSETLGSNIHIQCGKCVVELRTAGMHKGHAVHWFMKRYPFAGRYPVFIGDDATDEDGFRSAVAMGGLGIHVGQSTDTCANYSLADVQSTKDWLANVVSLARQEGTDN